LNISANLSIDPALPCHFSVHYLLNGKCFLGR
jgi:hypothetical protein